MNEQLIALISLAFFIGLVIGVCFIFSIFENRLIKSQEERNKLIRQIYNYRHAISMASIGSCNCLTKTNDWRHHHDSCRYKMLARALDEYGQPKSDTSDFKIFKDSSVTKDGTNFIKNIEHDRRV